MCLAVVDQMSVSAMMQGNECLLVRNSVVCCCSAGHTEPSVARLQSHRLRVNPLVSMPANCPCRSNMICASPASAFPVPIDRTAADLSLVPMYGRVRPAVLRLPSLIPSSGRASFSLYRAYMTACSGYTCACQTPEPTSMSCTYLSQGIFLPSHFTLRRRHWSHGGSFGGSCGESFDSDCTGSAADSSITSDVVTNTPADQPPRYTMLCALFRPWNAERNERLLIRSCFSYPRTRPGL